MTTKYCNICRTRGKLLLKPCGNYEIDCNCYNFNGPCYFCQSVECNAVTYYDLCDICNDKGCMFSRLRKNMPSLKHNESTVKKKCMQMLVSPFDATPLDTSFSLYARFVKAKTPINDFIDWPCDIITDQDKRLIRIFSSIEKEKDRIFFFLSLCLKSLKIEVPFEMISAIINFVY